MRTFEILGCGGFMLHERSADVAALFKVGAEYDDFGTADELRQKVAFYLEHEDQRKRIAAAGHHAVLSYTYRQWAERVLAVCLEDVHSTHGPHE
jgi:spore maturation protein CgeB